MVFLTTDGGAMNGGFEKNRRHENPQGICGIGPGLCWGTFWELGARFLLWGGFVQGTIPEGSAKSRMPAIGRLGVRRAD
jgi:hypothetical protein